MTKKLFFLVVAIAATGVSSYALATTSCYCEVGNYPPDQQKFFRAGCDLWLKDQKNCDFKKTVSQNYNYRSVVDFKKTNQLKIGYVGHWSNASETIQHLHEHIVPLAKEFSISLDVDNTACKALDDPYYVNDYLKTQRLPANSAITYKGNQVNSVGLWEKLLGPSLNLNASVSSVTQQVSFPRCLLFEGRNCLGNIQANNSGLCLDQNKKLMQLTCCKKRIDIGAGDAPNYQDKFIWSDQCSD